MLTEESKLIKKTFHHKAVEGRKVFIKRNKTLITRSLWFVSIIHHSLYSYQREILKVLFWKLGFKNSHSVMTP